MLWPAREQPDSEQQQQQSEMHASDFAQVAWFPLWINHPVPAVAPPHLTSTCGDLQITLMAGHSSVAATRTSACEVNFWENPTFKNRNSQNRWAGEVDDYLYLLYIGIITELFLYAIFSQNTEEPSNLTMPINIYFYSISSLPPGVRRELFQTLSVLLWLSPEPSTELCTQKGWQVILTASYTQAWARRTPRCLGAAWMSDPCSQGVLATTEQGRCVRPTWPAPALAGVICAKLEEVWVCSVCVYTCKPTPLWLENRQSIKNKNIYGL